MIYITSNDKLEQFQNKFQIYFVNIQNKLTINKQSRNGDKLWQGELLTLKGAHG